MLLDMHLKGDVVAHVSEDIMQEARTAFEQAKRKTGVDLWQVFLEASRQGGIRVLPSVSQKEASQYNQVRGNGDRKVVAVARRYEMVLVTNDIHDFEYADTYGIKVVTPGELSRESVPWLRNIVLGFLATPTSGAFYVEADALWAQVEFDPSLEKRFYFFEADLIGALFYDNHSRSIVFEGSCGQVVRLQLPAIGEFERPLKLALCYDNGKGIELYHGYRGRKAHWTGSWIPTNKIENPKISVGSSRQVTDHLNGWLYKLVSIPRALTERAVNNLMEGKRIREPWERLSLEEIIRFWYT